MNLVYKSSEGPEQLMGYKRILEIAKDLEGKLGIQFSKAQKLLLLERGTLEGLLTVLQGNPISVRVIKQGFVERTFVRNVILVDSKTNEDLVEAESIVFLDRLDVEVADDLREGRLGIGEIMAKHEKESRREFVEVGFDEKLNSFYRVYDIHVRGKPWFRIKEVFSASLYKNYEEI